MYRKYVTTGPNGQPLLYAKLLKALYELLRSTLLFYNLFEWENEELDKDITKEESIYPDIPAKIQGW